MNFEKYYQWSLIDPKPIVFFNNEIDDWCVYWNGIFMLYNAAFSVAGYMMFKSPIATETAAICNHKFRVYLESGFFDKIKDDSWYSIAGSGVVSYYQKKLAPHIKSNLKGFDKFEILRIFLKRYE